MMAVPAEEQVDVECCLALREEGKIGFLRGKQELIRWGHFDDVDVVLMVHAWAWQDDSNFSVGGTSNAHLAKYVHFQGGTSHAGSSPRLGVNALQAAMVSLKARKWLPRILSECQS